MKKLLSRLDWVGRRLEDTALVLLLCGMMLLAVGQIVLREIFSTGFVWADELVKLMLLWLAMVGSIAASRDDRHIRIDALSHLFPPLAIRLTRIVVDSFAAAVCAVIAWHAYRYVKLVDIEFGDTVLIDTPAWIVHAIVPLAFLLISYRFVVLVVWQLVGIFSEEEPDEVTRA
ncbi:MAG: TRAP transporter small permease [Woeseiaceae bacterium]|nr:TRAP transporter small permease [Woeseiaceae bacterium]